MNGMAILMARVDNRLVHGQVIEAWVPKLGADAVLAVDRQLSSDPLQRKILEGLGRGTDLEVRVAGPEEAVNLLEGAWRAKRLLILFAGIPQALEARRAGVAFQWLNLGNVHPRKGSRPVTASVSLTEEDLEALRGLIREGVRVEIRAVPADRSPDMEAVLVRTPRGRA